MVAWRVGATAVMLATVLMAMPGTAQGEFPGCGDIELVFRNPDLQMQGDGFVHAAGSMFIQFQAVGQGADQIATFGFSFGPDTVEFDEAACDQPIWFTGPYVMNYRADRDPSDGFFIPLKTDLVPDGTYAAAVHAYDANNNELARFWARAVVDNCDAEGPTARCVDDRPQQIPHDITAPWPIVLPGDGAAMEGRHLSIEFAEPIVELKVSLNGEDITANLTEWDGRIWDADYFPDYGPAGVGNAVSPPCSQPYHTCIKYGPAYEWNVRPLTNDDVLRVEAVDENGNRAVKDLHVGSGAAGGAVTSGAPNLQINLDEASKMTTPTTPVVFRFDMQNSGGGTAHPFTEAEAPEGWSADFLPHEPVEPNSRATQELTVIPPAGTAAGTYQVNATIAWPKDGGEERRTWELEVLVNSQAGGPITGPNATEPAGNPDEKDSPAAGVLIAPVIVALAIIARRRK